MSEEEFKPGDLFRIKTLNAGLVYSLTKCNRSEFRLKLGQVFMVVETNGFKAASMPAMKILMNDTGAMHLLPMLATRNYWSVGAIEKL